MLGQRQTSELMNFRLQAIDEFPVAPGNEPDSSTTRYRNQRCQNHTGTERHQQDHPERTLREFPAWIVHRDGLSVAARKFPTRNEQAHEDNDRQQSTRKPHLALSPFELGAQPKLSSGSWPGSAARP
jgi:hypothetical protein